MLATLIPNLSALDQALLMFGLSVGWAALMIAAMRGGR